MILLCVVAAGACARSGSGSASRVGFARPQPPPPQAFGPPPAPIAALDPPRLGPASLIRRGGGTYKIGRPYQIKGQWHYPKEDPTYDRVGVASWYGTDFHAKPTANGETFDMNALTAAHPTLPLPSYAYVTNIENGRTLLVRINDRGPYVPGRMIDLSKRVAQLLGYERLGTARVRVRYAGRAPLDGDEARERAHLEGQPWARTATAEAASRRSGAAR